MKKYIGLMGVLLILMSLIFSPIANAANLDPSKLTMAEIEREKNSHPSINEKQKALTFIKIQWIQHIRRLLHLTI
ncbi:hypothetical protein [Paradesulfitobacterium ferrireducens]|uniref:hypothetical protein n=1 Tax=Paradesulfitobacterium ferrireducens TaxID=2816476 RepID=UPI001A8E5FE2|nr:hypothetical protein [Paradesulfitobacterium ferrireducens]